MSRFMKLLSLFSLASAVAASPILRRDGVVPDGITPPGLVKPNEAGALTKRDVQDDYDEVFSGTGTGPDDRDASIQGTDYLTFTVLHSADYNAGITDCLNFCNGVQGCVFANLYYEYNTDPSGPLLKCAVYGMEQSADEKKNFGGQQLLPPPAGTTYIQQSSGWLLKSFENPPTPDGYELVFGPIDGATNAGGYMGFTALQSYDVNACAQECNKRGPDGNGGACQFFNIWRALTNGNPTGYTCAMYYQVADQSTATNYGQGDLKVTLSRGYRRISALTDGGFEGYQGCGDFCFTASYANWVGTSPSGGTLDATIFHYQPYAHSGSGVGLLGSATGADALTGTLTPANPLNTVAGKTYVVTFFLSTAFSGPSLEAGASLQVQWNGATVKTIADGYENWTYYQVQVTAAGNDQLAFVGGAAPAWIFLDDVYVFEM